ncbi:hypothetical protein ACLKA7_006840 [Drosophila subpalustris]
MGSAQSGGQVFFLPFWGLEIPTTAEWAACLPRIRYLFSSGGESEALVLREDSRRWLFELPGNVHCSYPVPFLYGRIL